MNHLKTFLFTYSHILYTDTKMQYDSYLSKYIYNLQGSLNK